MAFTFRVGNEMSSWLFCAPYLISMQISSRPTHYSLNSFFAMITYCIAFWQITMVLRADGGPLRLGKYISLEIFVYVK